MKYGYIFPWTNEPPNHVVKISNRSDSGKNAYMYCNHKTEYLEVPPHAPNEPLLILLKIHMHIQRSYNDIDIIFI